MLLTPDKLPDILRAIIVSPSALAHDLSILKLAGILASISHQKDTFSGFSPIDECTLVLEVWVSVSISALTVAQLCHRVNIADISVLRHFELETALRELRHIIMHRRVLLVIHKWIRHTDGIDINSIM